MTRDNILVFRPRPRDIQTEVMARSITAPLMVSLWWYQAMFSWWAPLIPNGGTLWTTKK